MRIVIHCGAYKTGSSSIQNFLYANRVKLLSEYKVFYPTAGIYYSKEIGYRHTKLFYSFGKDGWDGYIEAMREQLQKASNNGAEVAVISSEALSNPLLHPALEEFVEKLRSWGFDNIEGFVYVRNWYDYVIRHYREFTLRHNNKKKISEWISKNSNVFDYPSMLCDLRLIFRKNFSVIAYEEVGSVLEDFCTWLAIPEIESKEVRVNEGVSPIDIEFSRICNVKNLPKESVVHSDDVKRELGISFDREFSDIPELLFSSDFVENLEWKRLQDILTKNQIDLIKIKPDADDLFDIKKVSDVISVLIDKVVK